MSTINNIVKVLFNIHSFGKIARILKLPNAAKVDILGKHFSTARVDMNKSLIAVNSPNTKLQF